MGKKRSSKNWKSPAQTKALQVLTERSMSEYVALARQTSYWRQYGGDGSTVEPVTVYSAMRSAAVWACIRAIVSQICSLPINVTNGKKRLEELPQIVKRPNPRYSQRAWVGQIVRSLLTTGNLYGEIVQVDNRGNPTIVEIYDPALISWTHREEPMVLGEIQSLWPIGDFWHVPVSHLLPPGSRVALGPIEYASRSIASGLKAEKFGGDFFEAGGTPVAILKSTVKGLTEKAAEDAKQNIVMATRNSRPAVLGAEWDLSPFTVDMANSQMIEAQRFAVEQACRWFGVPPSMVYASVSGASLTYANITQSDLYFLKYSINGWLQDVEDYWSDFLPEGQFVKFNTDAILRLDKKARTEEHGLRLAQKTRTINEVRILEDEEPFDDPIYDEPGIPETSAPGADPAPPVAPGQPSPPGVPGSKMVTDATTKKPPGQSVIGKRDEDLREILRDGIASVVGEVLRDMFGGGRFDGNDGPPFLRYNKNHDKEGRFAEAPFSSNRCWAGMSSVSPEDHEMINERIMARTGLTREEFDQKMAANLDAYYERGKDNEAAREWYNDAHRLTADMADKYEARRLANGISGPPISQAVVADMVARTSPQTAVDVNVRIVDSILDEYTSKSELTFSKERLAKYEGWKASKEWPLPEGFKAGKRPINDDIPSLLLVGGEGEGYNLTVSSRTTSNSAKALDRVRGLKGRSEILEINGPKISSFSTNITQPDRNDISTMDSHHYYAAFQGIEVAVTDGGPRKTLERWKTEDHLDPQSVVQNFAVRNVDRPTGPRTKYIGFYPLAVDHMQQLVRRREAAGDNVSIHGAQSVIWHVSRTDRGNHDVPLAVTRKKIGL